jgi:hypothetical protein
VVTPSENNPYSVAVRLAGDGDLENAHADKPCWDDLPVL